MVVPSPSRFLASFAEPFLRPLGYEVYITGAPEENQPHVVFYDYGNENLGYVMDPDIRGYQQPRVQIRLVAESYDQGYSHLDDLLYELRKIGRQKLFGSTWSGFAVLNGPFLLSRDKDGWYNIVANVMISRSRESY